MASKSARRLRLALLMMLGLAAIFVIYRYTLRRMIESKLDEIRKQGYPVTLAELDKWYPQPPPGENAADIYMEAFQRHVNSETDTNLPIVGSVHLPERGTPLPTEIKEGIADYLAANRESLNLLHKAATMKPCRYPSDLSTPNKMISSQMKQFTSARRGERLLCLESLLASANGDAQGAVKSVAAMVAMAETLKDRSLLISYLVERACLGMAISSLEQALSRVSFTDPQISELSTSFQEAEATNSLTRALIGERAWANEEWGEIRRGKVLLTDLTRFSDEGTGSLDHVISIIYRPSGLIDLDYYVSLNWLEGLINSSTIPFPQRFERVDSLKRNVERLKVCPLTRMDAAMLGDSTKHDARFIAQLRAVCTSLGIERYRLANGTPPDSLSNLLPVFLKTIPTDPFDSQPLRYKKLAKGYVVYSVGEDGKDDGGDEKKDITFTVER